MCEDIDFIDIALKGRRSLETVLAELVAKHNRSPSPGLARMIQGIEAEIIQRRRLAGISDTRASPLPRIPGTGAAVSTAPIVQS
jgi:hypothetical protein